jgi:predicted dehydrogenase
VADAERAIAECERAGVKLGMNLHNRYMPPFVDAKRIVESGEIGDVNLVYMEVSPGARPGGRLATWRVDPVLAGLGTTMSIGVHAYDILRFILGSEIVTVTALFDTPRNVMEEMNLSLFKFTNGAMAHLSVHENSPFPHNDFVIYGTKGRITGRGVTRSRAGGVMEVLTQDGNTRQQEYAPVNAHESCVVGFSKALLEGRDPSPSGIDGLRSIQLTEAMAKSAWDGMHVRLAS